MTFFLLGLDTLGRFSAYFTREAHFVTSRLFSCIFTPSEINIL